MAKKKKLKAEVVTNLPQKSSDITSRPTDDALALYLSEISQYTLLTKKEERELSIRYLEKNDLNAAKKLVTSNLRFVVKIALEYSKFEARIIDLIQEGNLGLMHAVKAFDPHKGTRLITYAVWWIRGYIREYLMKNYSQIKIGTTTTQRKLFYKLKSEIQKLESQGIEGDVKLLSQKLGASPKEITDMKQRLTNKDISLDMPLNDDPTCRLVDLQTYDSQNIDEKIAAKEESTIVRKNIDKLKNTLNEKEIYIIENRLLTDTPKTLQEIGNKFNITRERTRQIEKKLLGKIKEVLEKT